MEETLAQIIKLGFESDDIVRAVFWYKALEIARDIVILLGLGIITIYIMKEITK